jgi:hypothetical protein
MTSVINLAAPGIAHSTSEDDEYKGYFIPKGTIILPAAWSVRTTFDTHTALTACVGPFSRTPKCSPIPSNSSRNASFSRPRTAIRSIRPYSTHGPLRLALVAGAVDFRCCVVSALISLESGYAREGTSRRPPSFPRLCQCLRHSMSCALSMITARKSLPSSTSRPARSRAYILDRVHALQSLRNQHLQTPKAIPLPRTGALVAHGGHAGEQRIGVCIPQS